MAFEINNRSVASHLQSHERGPEPAKNGGNALPYDGNPEPSLPTQSVESSARQISQFMIENARSLLFRVDEGSGRTVLTVVNPSSGEIIRQIPSEEVLHLASQLRRTGRVHLIRDEI